MVSFWSKGFLKTYRSRFDLLRDANLAGRSVSVSECECSMSMSTSKDEPKRSILVTFDFLPEILRYSSIVSLLSFAAASFVSLSSRSSGDSFGGGCIAVVSGSSDGKRATKASSGGIYVEVRMEKLWYPNAGVQKQASQGACVRGRE